MYYRKSHVLYKKLHYILNIAYNLIDIPFNISYKFLKSNVYIQDADKFVNFFRNLSIIKNK